MSSIQPESRMSRLEQVSSAAPRLCPSLCRKVKISVSGNNLAYHVLQTLIPGPVYATMDTLGQRTRSGQVEIWSHLLGFDITRVTLC